MNVSVFWCPRIVLCLHSIGLYLGRPNSVPFTLSSKPTLFRWSELSLPLPLPSPVDYCCPYSYSFSSCCCCCCHCSFSLCSAGSILHYGFILQAPHSLAHSLSRVLPRIQSTSSLFLNCSRSRLRWLSTIFSGTLLLYTKSLWLLVTIETTHRHRILPGNH